jgi:toxin YoeB
MNITFTTLAWEQFEMWLDEDESKVAKIRSLLKSIKQNPFKGEGKPEPLKHDLKGYWSRRINSEHRLVYRVSGKKPDQEIKIVQCHFHY